MSDSCHDGPQHMLTATSPAGCFAAARIIQEHVVLAALRDNLVRLKAHTSCDLIHHDRKTLPVLVDKTENLVILPDLRTTKKQPWTNCRLVALSQLRVA